MKINTYLVNKYISDVSNKGIKQILRYFFTLYSIINIIKRSKNYFHVNII